MGFLDKLFQKKEDMPVVLTEPGKLYAPVTGKLIALEEVQDEVFSQGILGKGCGIEPEVGEVVAPVSGMISTVAETKHAVGITAEDGAELLVHVGLDTVELNGQGFRMLITDGQKVVCGQKLMEVDLDAVKEAGYSVTTVFVVTNSDEFSRVEFINNRQVKAAEEIGRIEK